MSEVQASSVDARRRGWAWPVAMAFVRTPLMLAGALVVWATLAATGQADGFLLPLGTSLGMNLVNVACLVLLTRLVHREGRRLRDLLGFRRARFGRDVAWGVCWLLVLNAVYVIGFLVPLLAAGGTAGVADGSVFERAFVGAWADVPAGAFGATTVTLMALWMAAFPLLNAPVEEMQYRAYVQPRLQAATGRAWIAIAVPSVGFGLQHVLFAPSALGAVAYFGAFVIWGAGAGLVYMRQQRLMPLVIAHLITNVAVALPAMGLVLWG